MGKKEKERKAKQEKVAATPKDTIMDEAERISKPNTIHLMNWIYKERRKIYNENLALMKERDALLLKGRPSHEQEEWFQLIARRLDMEKRAYHYLIEEADHKKFCIEEWKGKPGEDTHVLEVAEMDRKVELREKVLKENDAMYKTLKQEAENLAREPPDMRVDDAHPARKVLYDYCRVLFRRYCIRSLGMLVTPKDIRPPEVRKNEILEVTLLAQSIEFLYNDASPNSLLDIISEERPAESTASSSRFVEKRPVTRSEISRLIVLQNALMTCERKHMEAEGSDESSDNMFRMQSWAAELLDRMMAMDEVAQKTGFALDEASTICRLKKNRKKK